MKLRILAYICLNFSFAPLYQPFYYIYAIYILTYVLLVCVWSGGEGAYLILCVLCSHIYGFLHLDSTTFEPLETLQPSRFKPTVILPSHDSMKTLQGPQTLFNGKCTCLVHVTHLLAP